MHYKVKTEKKEFHILNINDGNKIERRGFRIGLLTENFNKGQNVSDRWGKKLSELTIFRQPRAVSDERGGGSRGAVMGPWERSLGRWFLGKRKRHGRLMEKRSLWGRRT
ncbi:hypothetical protein H5410_057806 [Solanum commersonii]|uniref:Uncharacterized protein n=1 Tax=Solanum commersonii TaxID=4109 RepID=A0A9J5WRN6_SOLCO|nr:hypothetical protein H5410_057806 [Solanum commersonii]